LVCEESERFLLRKQLLDFHGEALLLMHWSIMTYTGLVKILKKYCKRTGALLRADHLRNLLSQPFCSTDVRDGLGKAGELRACHFNTDPPPYPSQLISCVIASVESLLAQLAVADMPAVASPRVQLPSLRPTIPEGGASTFEGGSSPPGHPDTSTAPPSLQRPLAGSSSRASLRAPDAATPDGQGSVVSSDITRDGACQSPAASFVTALEALPEVVEQGADSAPAPAAEEAGADDAPVAAVSDTAARSLSGSGDRIGRCAPSLDTPAVLPPRQLYPSPAVSPSPHPLRPLQPLRLMAEQDADESLPAICQQTRLALSTWHHLRTHASTPSTIVTVRKRAREETQPRGGGSGNGSAESRMPQ